MAHSSNANIASLADSGVLIPDVTALQPLIDAYLVMMQQLKNVITAQKVTTSVIKLLVRYLLRLLTQRLDLWVRRYMVSAPKFFQQYTNARIIIDRAGREKVEEEKKVAEVHVKRSALSRSLVILALRIQPTSVDEPWLDFNAL